MEALTKMPIPKAFQEIHVFNGMAQFYRCFIRNVTSVMAPVTTLLRKAKMFEWTTKCQIAWEDIKN
jgi:hypothetical protein